MLKDTRLINIEVGHILDIDCTDEELSDAYKAVCLELKKLEPVKEALQKAILDRVKPHDTKFANFWDIQTQERTRIEFPSKTKEKEVKELIKNIQQPFEKKYSLQIIKFPKY